MNNDPAIEKMLSASIRTPDDLVRLLDEATERVREKRGSDPRWTSEHYILPRMLVEAIVVGHLRAWTEPPNASWADPIVCEWANYVATCFTEDLKKKQTLLTLVPCVSAWLRDFPGYTRVASRFFDMEAAEQNMAAYLIDEIERSAR